MSVTYDFDTIFLLDSSEALTCFRYRLFCIKGFFSIICLNYEIGIILSQYQFYKGSASQNLKTKIVLHIIYVNPKKSSHLHEVL